MSPFSESILSTYDSEPTYHPSVGEQPYPGWRLALADQAGDVGTVMEWLMLAEDGEEPNSILSDQPISGADFSREHEGPTAEGGSVVYRQRDTIRPLKFSTSGRVARSYDAFMIPKINEESDGEDE
jgi:hypothetical protein